MILAEQPLRDLARASRVPAWLKCVAPGIDSLLQYRFVSDFRYDLTAGISVAAVALPVAVAYAQLAGFDPVVGLYSCILPLVAYALFGTSRQLIVNPDAATCAMVAASVAPLAAGDHEIYWSLSVTLAFLTGLFCVAASVLRLGALADFLSKPILVGFLNGVALSIVLGQSGHIFGFPIETSGVVSRFVEFAAKLPRTHVPTLLVGVATLLFLAVARRVAPRLPTALLALVGAGVATASLGLDREGVAVLGAIPAGLPPLRMPSFPLEKLPTLVAHAAGLALVLFSSGMLTARSFAEKNRYEIDADRDFAALGAANIASALSHGFAVTGADSRTAVADSAGGRTQVTGLVAAATLAVVLLFLTAPLRWIPTAALGAVLVASASSLVEVGSLREIWRIDRREVALSLITTVGVVAVGAIDAILVAVVLALVRFVEITARPNVEVLGEVQGLPGLHAVDRHPGARTWPGIVFFRFDGPIVFFNAPYFRRSARAAASATDLRWFVLDLIPVSRVDVTGLATLRDFERELEHRGVRLIYAGRKAEIVRWLQETGFYREEMLERLFPTLRQVLRTYRRRFCEGSDARSTVVPLPTCSMAPTWSQEAG
jgi:high affinity sulfate transporter 1